MLLLPSSYFTSVLPAVPSHQHTLLLKPLMFCWCFVFSKIISIFLKQVKILGYILHCFVSGILVSKSYCSRIQYIPTVNYRIGRVNSGDAVAWCCLRRKFKCLRKTKKLRRMSCWPWLASTMRMSLREPNLHKEEKQEFAWNCRKTSKFL